MSHGVEYIIIMNTLQRTINLEVGGKPLTGRLVVPEGADAVVVFSAGTGSAHHAGLETGLASLLHSKGVATMLVELISLDDTDERAVRTDTETLTDRLGAQFEWIAHSDATCEMSIALCGTGAGAAPALDYLIAGDHRVAGGAFVNGRLDHARHPPTSIASPVLFYLGDVDDHLEPQNRRAYVQAAVDDRHKQFFVDTDSGDVNVVSQWFTWLFTQQMARLGSAAVCDESEPPLKESE